MKTSKRIGRLIRTLATCPTLGLILAVYNSRAAVPAAPQTETVKTSDDIAGNEEVRAHIKKFQGRGQTVEAGGGVKALTPQESLQRFNLSAGLEISLAAHEPEARQPL